MAFEVKSKRRVKGAENFGIEDNSEEGGGLTDTFDTVVDVIDAFGLVESGFTKADFGIYIKGYMARIKEHLTEKHPERVEKFISGAQTLVKKVLADFNDFDFYMGTSMDAKGQIVFSYYEGEEEAPRFIFIRDGLKEEKY
eukprot:GHVT01016366.1.p1 GENE.GHVT01016366.1~~GHVT01016366.1.p1  ORF type:complete len:140 (+),score=30.96 GHVT01016366.1:399-818(+)